MKFPTLSSNLIKGACGRIGIVGGSFEYTGAPYFAAMASLLVGSDLIYIFTHKDAAPVIKSYSPDLIVFPILNNDSVIDQLPRIFSRLSALIIGPGLSSCPIMLESAFKFIQEAKNYKIPLILDADALQLLPKYPIKHFSNSIITPNIREFQKLFNSFNLELDKDHVKNVSSLALKLNLTIICKGEVDVISNGQQTLLSDCESGLRRVGGLGDILAGTLGTFIGWAKDDKFSLDQSLQACNLVRSASLSAFKRKRRCMRAQDVLDDLGVMANDLLDSLEQPDS